MVLNVTAMWKQETRRPPRGRLQPETDPSFGESWAAFCEGEHTIRRLIIVGIGTMGFGMADILLEPFGGQILNLDVAATTKLTALLAFGGLIGFAFASRVLGRGGSPYGMAQLGAVIGLPAFVFVIVAEPAGAIGLFLFGNFLIGFGAALFSHGTLTAAMNRAPKNQTGLALGAWGAVQATAAGVAVATSGALRDLVTAAMGAGREIFGFSGLAMGYITVYVLEITLLLVTIVAALPLIRAVSSRHQSGKRDPAPDAFQLNVAPPTANPKSGAP
jgi:BCD family chlorophyll transporter-like MFS transporter